MEVFPLKPFGETSDANLKGQKFVMEYTTNIAHTNEILVLPEFEPWQTTACSVEDVKLVAFPTTLPGGTLGCPGSPR